MKVNLNFNWKAFNPKLGLLMVMAIVLGFILANWVGLAGPIISLSALLTAMATVGVHGPLRDRMINILGQSSILGYVGTPDDHQTRSTPNCQAWPAPDHWNCSWWPVRDFVGYTDQ